MLKGRQLLLKRVEKGIKAKYIAKEIGVTGAYISMMEQEKINIPIHIYKKWIEVLNIKNENGDD